MPKGQLEKIKLFTKFLDTTIIKNFEKLTSIDSILNLPISAFDFLNDADVNLIENYFQIEDIGQFSSLDPVSPFKILYKDQNTQKKIEQLLVTDLEIEDKIKKAVLISNIAHKIKQESITLSKKEQKVIVVGLNNAGKTTILRKFGGEIGIKDLAKLRPTKGVERQEIMTSDMVLLLWDFGGQQEYRDKYLREPDKYFINIDLIIYVIDLQDPEKYLESVDYFEKIIDLIEKLEEDPYILIFIHKYDPDIKENPEVILNVEYVKDLVKKIFRERKQLDYDIYLSSIYSLLTKGPKFSRYLKETMKKTATLSDYKLEGMASILESTLNGIIRLSEFVMTEINKINTKIDVIEGKKPSPKSISNSLPPPEYSSTPPFTSTPNDKPLKPPPERRGKNAKKAVLDELKELLEKKGLKS
ncbi:MAG: ADP-ribosylation factor-like protein [Candidatus Hermodarchaeota archaeon]